MTNQNIPSKVVDAINTLANKLGLGDERTITECYEYNVRQYEGQVNDGIRSVDFDINLSDKYVCRINRYTRDRFDYLDI